MAIADAFLPFTAMGASTLFIVSSIILQILTWLSVQLPWGLNGSVWLLPLIMVVVDLILSLFTGTVQFMVLSMVWEYIWEAVLPRITGIDTPAMRHWKEKQNTMNRKPEPPQGFNLGPSQPRPLV